MPAAFGESTITMLDAFQAFGILAADSLHSAATLKDVHLAFKILGLLVVGAPVALFATLGIASLLRDRPLSERTISRCVQAGIMTGLVASITMLGLMLIWGDTQVPIEFGSWVHVENPKVEHDHYHFVFKFEFDRLSVPFVILTFVLCGTIGAFANRYMHRERGFNRFFVLFALFVVGMVTTSLAGTVETLFSGWELVGLSSALLVAFFHERPAPARNGLHVWIVYRVSDAALLMASVALHHMKGEGNFDKFLTGEWPVAGTLLEPNQAFFVGLLLLIAAMGKSAMVPFSGWLPRAMEGPTPSSAVFYGALSVHLGAFLLLRFSPILEQSLALRVLIVIVGIGSALFATFAGAVQTDIKSALSFASMSQVGLIFAEIGLGFRYLALVHILGHGCLRTLQFLRAPTLLYDYRTMEDAIGERLPKFSGAWINRTDESVRIWFYRLALERGYLDSWMTDYLVHPFLTLLWKCDSFERRWTKMLAGSDQSKAPTSEAVPTLEELL
jgi:NADH-quinone oxidoreductase subunit L